MTDEDFPNVTERMDKIILLAEEYRLPLYVIAIASLASAGALVTMAFYVVFG